MDQADLAQKYKAQLSQLKTIFPSWDESDLVYTLNDAKGSVEEAAVLITEGELWFEVVDWGVWWRCGTGRATVEGPKSRCGVLGVLRCWHL